jgi:hypothetical protein
MLTPTTIERGIEMLTVKFMKYGPENGTPSYTDSICIRTAESVHVKLEEDRSSTVTLDSGGETIKITVGRWAACEYNVAYVTNETGRTVETIK